ncbi:MAG: Asp-tRNA(Asn)/Glu-tRNA(Gln) amidotransferase subunit GatA [Phycisphaeraceae bacterium]|nr:Asp-tRNA(Asn)/Glu-tRNA(Gln) amidotransferase subunit GatA [Phycisphaeraceae bacterium]
MTPPTDSLAAIRRAILQGDLTAEQSTLAALHTSAAQNGTLNALITTFTQQAPEQARRIDSRLRAGEHLPLAGVPIVIKDNICLGPDLARPGDALGYGGPTTCASRILAEYHSPFTATAAQRLIDAGAIIIGKSNLDEFAMGSSTEHSAFGPTRNPHASNRVPGGSSGGSAAALAAGMCAAALGSDTGGSVRQPAALCGVVGVKPTYGRVSRWGLVAYASSLDQIGIFAHSVPDAASLLEIIAGHDPLDATSSQRPGENWSAAAAAPPPAGLLVGVPRQARTNLNHPAVSAAMRRCEDAISAAGGRIVEIDLTTTDLAVAAYYIVAAAEASSNLARFDGVRYGRRAALNDGEGLEELYRRSRAEGFGPEVKRRIMLGTHVLSSGYYDAYYLKALKVRRLIEQDFARAFAHAGCHALLMPTSPAPAFAIGEKASDPLALYLEDIYTVGVNLAGLPAISIPAGWAALPDGVLPVGVQVIAPAFNESSMFNVAGLLERSGVSRRAG